MKINYDCLSDEKLVKRAQAGDLKANALIVQRHQGLVMSLAQKHAFSPDRLEDLVSEGNIGLLKAIEKYHPGRNTKFSTYAYYWVRRYILRAINSEFVKVPEREKNLIRKVAYAGQQIRQTESRNPTVEEVARLTKLPLRLVKKIWSYKPPLRVTRAARFEEDEGPTEIELPASEPGFSFPERLMREDMIDDFFKRLAEKHKRANASRWFEILKLYWGFGNSPRMSCKKIGEKFNISRQRVHQIIKVC
ncbi:MAG: sigma-70 family RNA polymerase sigma factor, partial [Candidatus Omnitrophica bacterium]|nr:sigma-70 family RNA polymerase sigma factor [Candidatus Omnitrophota bacterium]